MRKTSSAGCSHPFGGSVMATFSPPDSRRNSISGGSLLTSNGNNNAAAAFGADSGGGSAGRSRSLAMSTSGAGSTSPSGKRRQSMSQGNAIFATGGGGGESPAATATAGSGHDSPTQLRRRKGSSAGAGGEAGSGGHRRPSISGAAASSSVRRRRTTAANGGGGGRFEDRDESFDDYTMETAAPSDSSAGGSGRRRVTTRSIPMAPLPNHNQQTPPPLPPPATTATVAAYITSGIADAALGEHDPETAAAADGGGDGKTRELDPSHSHSAGETSTVTVGDSTITATTPAKSGAAAHHITNQSHGHHHHNNGDGTAIEESPLAEATAAVEAAEAYLSASRRGEGQAAGMVARRRRRPSSRVTPPLEGGNSARNTSTNNGSSSVLFPVIGSETSTPKTIGTSALLVDAAVGGGGGPHPHSHPPHPLPVVADLPPRHPTEDPPSFNPPLYLRRAMLCIETLKRHRCYSFIDAGCSDGALLQYVVKSQLIEHSFRHVVGIDLSLQSLARTEAALPDPASSCAEYLHPVRIELVQADLTIPPPTGTRGGGGGGNGSNSNSVSRTDGPVSSSSPRGGPWLFMDKFYARQQQQQQLQQQQRPHRDGSETASSLYDKDGNNVSSVAFGDDIDGSSSSGQQHQHVPVQVQPMDAVLSIEVLEHIPPHLVAHYTDTIFAQLAAARGARVLILTTPNRAENGRFDSRSSGGGGSVAAATAAIGERSVYCPTTGAPRRRHPDHLFELTADQFRVYCDYILNFFAPYWQSYELVGLGDNFTQGAVFLSAEAVLMARQPRAQQQQVYQEPQQRPLAEGRRGSIAQGNARIININGGGGGGGTFLRRLSSHGLRMTAGPTGSARVSESARSGAWGDDALSALSHDADADGEGEGSPRATVDALRKGRRVEEQLREQVARRASIARRQSVGAALGPALPAPATRQRRSSTGSPGATSASAPLAGRATVHGSGGTAAGASQALPRKAATDTGVGGGRAAPTRGAVRSDITHRKATPTPTPTAGTSRGCSATVGAAAATPTRGRGRGRCTGTAGRAATTTTPKRAGTAPTTKRTTTTATTKPASKHPLGGVRSLSPDIRLPRAASLGGSLAQSHSVDATLSAAAGADDHSASVSRGGRVGWAHGREERLAAFPFAEVFGMTRAAYEAEFAGAIAEGDRRRDVRAASAADMTTTTVAHSCGGQQPLTARARQHRAALNGYVSVFRAELPAAGLWDRLCDGVYRCAQNLYGDLLSSCYDASARQRQQRPPYPRHSTGGSCSGGAESGSLNREGLMFGELVLQRERGAAFRPLRCSVCAFLTMLAGQRALWLKTCRGHLRRWFAYATRRRISPNSAFTMLTETETMAESIMHGGKGGLKGSGGGGSGGRPPQTAEAWASSLPPGSVAIPNSAAYRAVKTRAPAEQREGEALLRALQLSQSGLRAHSWLIDVTIRLATLNAVRSRPWALAADPLPTLEAITRDDTTRVDTILPDDVALVVLFLAAVDALPRASSWLRDRAPRWSPAPLIRVANSNSNSTSISGSAVSNSARAGSPLMTHRSHNQQLQLEEEAAAGQRTTRRRSIAQTQTQQYPSVRRRRTSDGAAPPVPFTAATSAGSPGSSPSGAYAASGSSGLAGQLPSSHDVVLLAGSLSTFRLDAPLLEMLLGPAQRHLTVEYDTR